MRTTKLMRRTFRVRCSSGHSCMEQERSNAPGRCIAPKLVLWLGMALILAFLLTAPLSVSAQGDADTIERLEVRLWPDFDRPSVLTTLVGFLPPGTPDPFSLTVPVPVDASIHAVSPLREDGSPGPEMAYDDSVPGQLTFSTSSTGFWLEYYSPYIADGNSRNLTFVWQSEIAIDELEAVVQQPMMSSDLTTDPDADSVTTGPQGMQYHQIRGRQVPAGSIYSLDANYTMVQPQLSQDALGQQSAAVGGSVEDESGFNWLSTGYWSWPSRPVSSLLWLLVGFSFPAGAARGALLNLARCVIVHPEQELLREGKLLLHLKKQASSAMNVDSL